MRHSRLLVILAVALISASLLALPGCSIREEKSGSSEKNVDISTPIGGLHVRTEVEAKDTGLSVYPGARRKSKDEHHGGSANLEMGGALFGMKVVAVEFESDDPSDKVKEFYRRELAKYGKVLECRGGVKRVKDTDEITCDENNRNSEHDIELVTGTYERQHIVGIKSKHSGCEFGLVYLQMRGKKESI